MLDLGDLKAVRLVTEAAYKYEGKEMSHCVASYANKKASAIYSIRDARNKPHATIEVDIKSNSIRQIKGKGNTFVINKYAPAVFDLIDHLKVKEISSYELKNIGLIELTKSIEEKLKEFLGLDKSKPLPGTVQRDGKLYVNESDTYWKK